MLLTVGHLADGSLVARRPVQRLNGGDNEVQESVIFLDLLSLRLLVGLLLGVHRVAHAGRRLRILHLFLAQVPQEDPSIVNARGQLVDIRQVLDALDEVVDEPGRVLGQVLLVVVVLGFIAMLRLLLVSTGALHEAAAGTQHAALVLVWLIVWITGFRLVIQLQQVDVPGVDSTLSSTREEKLLLLFAFLDIAEALLGVLNWQSLQRTSLAVLHLVEANGEVAEADSNGVTVSDELDGINLASALYARLLLHVRGVINADHITIRLKQNHLVYLLEVVYFLYLAVMRLGVRYIQRLLVEHIDLGRVLSVVLDLVLD